MQPSYNTENSPNISYELYSQALYADITVTINFRPTKPSQARTRPGLHACAVWSLWMLTNSLVATANAAAMYCIGRQLPPTQKQVSAFNIIGTGNGLD